MSAAGNFGGEDKKEAVGDGAKARDVLAVGDGAKARDVLAVGGEVGKEGDGTRAAKPSVEHPPHVQRFGAIRTGNRLAVRALAPKPPRLPTPVAMPRAIQTLPIRSSILQRRRKSELMADLEGGRPVQPAPKVARLETEARMPIVRPKAHTVIVMPSRHGSLLAEGKGRIEEAVKEGRRRAQARSGSPLNSPPPAAPAPAATDEDLKKEVDRLRRTVLEQGNRLSEMRRLNLGYASQITELRNELQLARKEVGKGAEVATAVADTRMKSPVRKVARRESSAVAPPAVPPPRSPPVTHPGPAQPLPPRTPARQSGLHLALSPMAPGSPKSPKIEMDVDPADVAAPPSPPAPISPPPPAPQQPPAAPAYVKFDGPGRCPSCSQKLTAKVVERRKKAEMLEAQRNGAGVAVDPQIEREMRERLDDVERLETLIHRHVSSMERHDELVDGRVSDILRECRLLQKYLARVLRHPGGMVVAHRTTSPRLEKLKKAMEDMDISLDRPAALPPVLLHLYTTRSGAIVPVGRPRSTRRAAVLARSRF